MPRFRGLLLCFSLSTAEECLAKPWFLTSVPQFVVFFSGERAVRLPWFLIIVRIYALLIQRIPRTPVYAVIARNRAVIYPLPLTVCGPRRFFMRTRLRECEVHLCVFHQITPFSWYSSTSSTDIQYTQYGAKWKALLHDPGFYDGFPHLPRASALLVTTDYIVRWVNVNNNNTQCPRWFITPERCKIYGYKTTTQTAILVYVVYTQVDSSDTMPCRFVLGYDWQKAQLTHASYPDTLKREKSRANTKYCKLDIQKEWARVSIHVLSSLVSQGPESGETPPFDQFPRLGNKVEQHWSPYRVYTRFLWHHVADMMNEPQSGTITFGLKIQ